MTQYSPPAPDDQETSATVEEFGYIPFPRVVLRQDGKIVARRRLWWPVAPGRVFRVPTGILTSVDPKGGPVRISAEA
ncbi:hypothetical protein [Streptosporangium sp. NPDC006007]|uniref:hypothetical protein n=1 Tax=Streptosporangium sp. NPDC006007 TaxID=3154575 RepID=UPI0033BAE2B7